MIYLADFHGLFFVKLPEGIQMGGKELGEDSFCGMSFWQVYI